MNERIRELAEQAANEIADLFRPGFFDDRMVNDVADINKKFAELIVQECAAICEDTEGDPSADSRWGRRCCALEIREHFGVEE